MGLSDLFGALARLFGMNPAPVVDVPTSSIESTKTDIQDPTAPLPAAPDTSFAMGGAEIAPAVPKNVPSDADDDAWLALCRPLSQHFESCYLTAYPDPASPLGKALQARGLWYKVLGGAPIPSDPALRALSGAPWTCGWGSTGPDVREGTVWTQATADARHDANLRAAAALIDQAARVQLSAQQKAAMTSIVNNVGAGRARRAGDPGRDGIITLASGQPSTLLRHLNIGDFAGAADQFPAWNRAGGVVQPGLVRRRAAERDLFLTGHWSAS
ncbi:peptidase [Burkholderia pseudomallei]|uniref:lysozyme n=2 Tax=Burkholderia pseudomallei TaxID=28450 RepID=UPI0000F28F7B|nr:lysozyme [Burkholderia pseudomallei]ABN85615.1 phage-related lysozyme [Burkholderia pseudomallei 668]AJX88974.1 phage lysozyme family protein [Burkholderia pseudomallei]KGW44030.1 phage lysozyme family protein [Burkholderia pseudomallei MSHR1000]ONC33773.1 peptidase [Burkholderia pseudomallei]ONC97042.1 peptidase [Burkholderia pseudomallei]